MTTNPGSETKLVERLEVVPMATVTQKKRPLIFSYEGGEMVNEIYFAREAPGVKNVVESQEQDGDFRAVLSQSTRERLEAWNLMTPEEKEAEMRISSKTGRYSLVPCGHERGVSFTERIRLLHESGRSIVEIQNALYGNVRFNDEDRTRKTLRDIIAQLKEGSGTTEATAEGFKD